MTTSRTQALGARKYRKKPVVIEAIQFYMPSKRPERSGPDTSIPGLHWHDFGSSQQHPCCHTLEGRLLVSDGDWIIKGVKGEFYPCKPDIFAATYEPAIESSAPSAAEPVVIYSPIACRSHEEKGGRHPNDNERSDPDRSKYLDERGDDEGQGLCHYWKWGHAAGWNDHKRHVAATPASQPTEAEPGTFDRLLQEFEDAVNEYRDTDPGNKLECVGAQTLMHQARHALRSHVAALKAEGPVTAPAQPAASEREAPCRWCCGTGRFSDHDCRFCAGRGVAAIAAAIHSTGKPDGEVATVTDEMVTRFLGWKLPQDFAPDCGISFTPIGHPNGWPIGTNLLNATQARQMLAHVLAAPADAPKPDGDVGPVPDHPVNTMDWSPVERSVIAKFGVLKFEEGLRAAPAAAPVAPPKPDDLKTQWAKWFPTDVLMNPMREVPGKPGSWETARWPSEQDDAPVAEPVALAGAPERIWLNLFDTPEDTDGVRLFPSDHEGITWAEEEVGDYDVQYVRADLAARPPAEDAKDAAHKPLTEEQINAIRADPNVWKTYRGVGALFNALNFARAIEAAHGITDTALSQGDGA